VKLKKHYLRKHAKKQWWHPYYLPDGGVPFEILTQMKGGENSTEKGRTWEIISPNTKEKYKVTYQKRGADPPNELERSNKSQKNKKKEKATRNKWVTYRVLKMALQGM